METFDRYGHTDSNDIGRDARTDRPVALPQSRFRGGAAFVSLNFSMDRPLSSDEQRQLFTAWLTSTDARLCAKRLVSRYGVPAEAEDVLSESWVRLSSALQRRGDPYPGILDVQTATRFAYRTLDNVCRDLARANRRRGEVVPLHDDKVVLFGADHYGSIEQRLLLEQLLATVGRMAAEHRHCAGCPAEVAAATALEAIHLMLRGDVGDESGRTWLDRILYQALENVDGNDNRTAEARRQRKSRCGRCASELLADGLISLGVEP